MTAEERLDSLSEPYWSYKEIMDYFNCKSTKAAEIKKKAIKEHNGAVQYHADKVSIDAVLRVMGSSLDEEIAKQQKIINAKKGLA
jgi:hypothetical protein